MKSNKNFDLKTKQLKKLKKYQTNRKMLKYLWKSPESPSLPVFGSQELIYNSLINLNKKEHLFENSNTFTLYMFYRHFDQINASLLNKNVKS